MSHPPYSVAVLTSHPIQYQAPLFRALTETGEVDLRVLFCSSYGVGSHVDKVFGTEFAWDIPLLEGYKYTFLKTFGPRPGPGRVFTGCINPEIRHVLAQRQYDAVWIHGWSQASCWLAFQACRKLNIPIVLRGETNGLREPSGPKGLVKKLILSRLFREVSAFLAIGTNNAAFYSGYAIPPEKMFLTPYAVDNSFFLSRSVIDPAEKRRLREREGIAPDLPVILFCGKFADYKNPLELLLAFRQLNKNPESSLVFAGDGPLKSAMKNYVAEQKLKHVHFLGFRNQTQLPACYALADVFVLPSRYEAWGLVVNEAMCSGLPIIASDKVGAARDLVREGVNGFVYPSGNASLLADRLQRILGDENLRRDMSAQSRAVIQGWGIGEAVTGVLRALEYLKSTSRSSEAAG